MDQAMRHDIAAATAAHRELGRDYDDAIAESLVDRIGTEIDKRIDARVGRPQSASRSPREFSRSGKSEAMWIGAGIGAGLTGLVAITSSNGNTGIPVVQAMIAVWVVLAIALGAVVVRRHRR